MKNWKTYLLPLIAISLFTSTASFGQKVGTTSMQFLKVMPCARAAALGDAYSVLATGAEAAFWNPARVTHLDGSEISSTYIMWMMDTKLGALSYATSLNNYGALGISMQFVDYGEMQEAVWNRPYSKYDPFPGLTGRTFRPYAFVVGLSYSKQLTDRFSTGISLKYARESLFDGNTATAMISQNNYEDVKTYGSGLLFDFGMYYNTGFKSIQLGISVQNFGADIEYAKESTPVPLQFRWGIAADIMGPDAVLIAQEKNRLTMAFDLFQPNDYAQQEHLGLEYVFDDLFALRGGYKFNYDSESLTAGVGIKQSFGSVKLSFDYSYGSIGNYLGDVHRISLGAAL